MKLIRVKCKDGGGNFEVGDKVKVVGTLEWTINGKIGTVVSVKLGSYEVLVNGKKILLKQENVEEVE